MNDIIFSLLIISLMGLSPLLFIGIIFGIIAGIKDMIYLWNNSDALFKIFVITFGFTPLLGAIILYFFFGDILCNKN